MKVMDFEMLGKMLLMLGEDTVRRMLTIPGAVCTKQALKNKDNPEEMIAKRDAWVEATLEFAKEFANLDND